MQLTRIYHNVLVVYLAFWHQRWLRLLQVTWHSKEMDRCLFTYENPHLEISNYFTNPNCSSKITEDIKMSHFILTIWGETFTKTFLKKCLEWPTYQDWRIDRQNNIQARVIYLLGLPPTCFSFFNISWELGFFHLLCAAWKGTSGLLWLSFLDGTDSSTVAVGRQPWGLRDGALDSGYLFAMLTGLSEVSQIYS